MNKPVSQRINKFPANDGLLIFPISMSRISNSQNGKEYFNIVHELTSKISRPVVGCVFIYTDALYTKYHQETGSSRDKYLDLMISHKNQFMKELLKNSYFVERAFSFMSWSQLCLQTRDFTQKLSLVKKLYHENEEFKRAVDKDIQHTNRELNEDNVMFILEETLMSYLILKEQLDLNNEFVHGRDKWRIIAYKGKPNYSFICFFQLNPLNISSTNPYENYYFNLEDMKLYCMGQMDIE